MRYLALLILPILLSGCHFGYSTSECHYDDWGNYHCHEHDSHHDHQSTTVVVTETGGGYNNNIIVVEEQTSWCSWNEPYYHDAEYCTFDSGDTCCTWQASSYGLEETYCYSDWCGWELVSVYEYYQKEYPYEEDKVNTMRCLLPAFPQHRHVCPEKP